MIQWTPSNCFYGRELMMHNSSGNACTPPPGSAPVREGCRPPPRVGSRRSDLPLFPGTTLVKLSSPKVKTYKIGKPPHWSEMFNVRFDHVV